MPIALVIGSGGLIGSEAVRHFAHRGFDVVGIDNDMRAYFFGDEASTEPTMARLSQEQVLREIHDLNREQWTAVEPEAAPQG
jgi:nucleoside-diphosphate-sugar epimerase